MITEENKEKMEESKQRLQHFLMHHMQKQQQQAAMSRSSSTIGPPGLLQNRPVNPSLQNVDHNHNFQQQNVTSQMMRMQQQQQQQKPMTMMMQQQQQQQQEQQKSIRPSNQLELQFAYQDAWRVCHPDFKRPFTSLEDACERLLPYHVVSDYEAEEEDSMILDSDTTSLSRSQQWDNNIAAKVAEFTAKFEKQVQAFNVITQKRRDGELRTEERLMVEQRLFLEERKACIDVKSELDREMKAQQEARLRMAALAQAGQVKVESNQSMMARDPLRGNAIGNYGEQQQRNVNPDEMMMMHGWVNTNSSQREEKEPLEDFLNDEETGYQHENWRGNGEFDLNAR